jgi:hypothetical protein
MKARLGTFLEKWNSVAGGSSSLQFDKVFFQVSRYVSTPRQPI